MPEGIEKQFKILQGDYDLLKEMKRLDDETHKYSIERLKTFMRGICDNARPHASNYAQTLIDKALRELEEESG